MVLLFNSCAALKTDKNCVISFFVTVSSIETPNEPFENSRMLMLLFNNFFIVLSGPVK